MDRNQVIHYCLSLNAAVEKDSGHPHNIKSYSVGQKKFAYFKTSEPEKWRFSLRVPPYQFLELTDQPGIKPARYMHRFHWITIVKVQSIDKDIMTQLIGWSYDKAISSLTIKLQKQLLLNTPS